MEVAHMLDLNAIRQLTETNTISEANDRLRNGWILINTYTTEFGIMYVLGNPHQ
jgi:hypothetical protein